jgi:hypothetical protein
MVLEKLLILIAFSKQLLIKLSPTQKLRVTFRE